MRAIFRTLLASGAVFGWGAGALATDLPAYRAAPAAAPFSWSGFYWGGNFGYGWAKITDPVTGESDRLKGILGGAQAGVNWQAGFLVAGLEIDAQATGQSLPFDDGAGDTAKARIDWFGTARGRLGVGGDRWLVYGTGGAAYSKLSIKGTVAGVGPFSMSETRPGLAAGGGFEFSPADHWSWKVEYLRVATKLGETFGNARLNNDIIRAGLNYRY